MKLQDMIITNRNLKVSIIYESKQDPIITFNLHTHSFQNAMTKRMKECEIDHIHLSNNSITIYIKEV